MTIKFATQHPVNGNFFNAMIYPKWFREGNQCGISIREISDGTPNNSSHRVDASRAFGTVKVSALIAMRDELNEIIAFVQQLDNETGVDDIAATKEPGER